MFEVLVTMTPGRAGKPCECTIWEKTGNVVGFGCLRVVNQMSYLTVGSLENTSRLVDVSLNWTINSTG